MANKNILTTASKTLLTEQVYFSPVAVVPPQEYNAQTIFTFLSKVEPWTDDQDIPTPTSDQKYVKQVFKNIFAVKRLSASNIAAVIPRIDWVSGTVYEEYSDQVDNFITVDGIVTKQFYVRNSYDQIFKCLFNNNGADSTIEPSITPGNTNTSRAIILDDGYKWIYITTIDKGLKQKFFDDNWMPISFGAYSPKIGRAHV